MAQQDVAAAPPQGYPPQRPPPPTQVHTTQGHTTQGYPTQSYTPQGYPFQGYPSQSYPSQGYPSQGYAPQGYNVQYVAQAPPVMVAPMGGAVIIHQGSPMFGEQPVSMTCSHCQAQIVTRINYEVGAMAWLIAAIMFLVGLWLCCLIPFCIDDLKDVIHSCPNCNHQVGRKNRL